jgi:hypothetical protein
VRLRGRARRWLTGSGTVVLLAVTSAGCGQGTSTGDVTMVDAASAPPGGLIDDPTDDRFRFTTTTEVVTGDRRTALAPPVTGMVDRRRAQLLVDVSGRLAPGELPDVEPDDLAVEARVDAEGLYLRAPFMVAAADRLVLAQATSPFPPAADPGALSGDDGWVAVDAEALGAPWREAAGRLAGIQDLEPGVFAELAETAAAPGPGSLGGDTIDGVAVTGVQADVDHLRALRALGFPVTELAGLADVLQGRTVPLEVWSDADDLVRRVVLGVGWAPMADAAADGGVVPAGIARLAATLTTRIDITDYGDGDITVVAPARAVDVSSTYRADRPDGGVDVLTDGWLHDLKDDLTAVRDELDLIASFQQLQAQMDGLNGPGGLGDLGDLAGSGDYAELDLEPLPEYSSAETEALLAEGQQLMADIEAHQTETDRVLQESEALQAETEQVLADNEQLLAELEANRPHP